MNLQNRKLFTSKFVGTGPSSYEKKRIYRAAVSQVEKHSPIASYVHMSQCHFLQLPIYIANIDL